MKRFCLILLVLLTFFVIHNACAVSADDYTCFLQTDPQWASTPYGYVDAGRNYPGYIGLTKTYAGETYWYGSGCGLVSLTNAVYALNGTFLNPSDLAAWSLANNFRINGSGTKHSFPANYVASHNLGIQFDGDEDSVNERVKQHILNGGVAIINVVEHFACLVAYDETTNRYLALDSAPSKNRMDLDESIGKGKVWLTPEQLRSHNKWKVNDVHLFSNDPVKGWLDMACTCNGHLRLMGWALREKMPNEPVELKAVINVNGIERTELFQTDLFRADIAGGVGEHGFDQTFPTPGIGSGTVSVYMKEVSGSWTLMNNRSYPIRMDSPTDTIRISEKNLNYKPGDIFNKTYRSSYTGQEGFAYWCESRVNGVTSLTGGAYRTTQDPDEIGIQFWIREGTVIRLGDGKVMVGVSGDSSFARFLMLNDFHQIEQYSVCWDLIQIFIDGLHGGAVSAEAWEHVGDTLIDGECEVTSPVSGGVYVRGWVNSESTQPVDTIVINIGGVNHTMHPGASDDGVTFSWLISTEKTGRTLVVVTARNPGSGEDAELFRGYVDIPAEKVNRDCRILIDSPQGTYPYNASPEISGFIASNVPVASLTAYGIAGMDDISLTGSLSDASAALSSMGYGSYAYKYRFSGTIPRGQIINGTELRLYIKAAFTDGSYADPVSTAFRLELLVIRDGTNMDTWFSETPGGPAGSSFEAGRTVYLCYRLTSAEKGTGVDLAHPDYTYNVRVSVVYPDSITRRYDFSTDENWVGIETRQAGHYDITVSGSGDISVTTQELALDVPSRIIPKARVWNAYTADEMQVIGESSVGGTYYAHYELLDMDSGKRLNQAAVNYGYTAVLEAIGPNGAVIASQIFSNADFGAMPFTIQEAGQHIIRVRCSGNVDGMDAEIYTRSLMFTAREEETRIRLNASACVVEPGKESTYLAFKSGWSGAYWDYRITPDNDCVRVTWTSEVERVNRVKVMKISGIREGTASALLELYDTRTGMVYASERVYIFCRVPTYFVDYDANGGMYRPEADFKRKDEPYRIPKAYYSYGGSHAEEYLFCGWSTNPDAQIPEYYPGSAYTLNADVTFYAVWDHGARYTYQANGGECAVKSEWHSYATENTPFRLSGAVPVRNGYLFKGWSRSANAAAAEYQPGDPCTRSGNQTFYAVWEADPNLLAFGTSGEVNWTLNREYVLSVTGSGAMADYAAASEQPWYGQTVRTVDVANGVTAIGKKAFHSLTELTYVSLPASLEEIQAHAFYGCTALTAVRLPGQLRSIGNGAFSSCRALTEIDLPDSVTTLGTSVFEGCYALTGIRLPSAITVLPDFFLHSCRSLESLTLPGSLRTIERWALGECAKLSALNLPAHLESIGEYALTRAPITSLVLPDTLQSMGQGAFAQCSQLRRVKLSAGLTGIPRGAFFGCGALEQIILPDGITSIEEKAFENCTALYGATLPAGLASIGPTAFAGDTNLSYLTVRAAGMSIDATAFSGPQTLTVYGIPGGSCETFFRGLSGITVTFSPIITGSAAFTVDSGGVLTAYSGMGGDVTLPAGLGITVIGEGAFANCPVINSIVIPSTVTEIRDQAFLNCRALSSVQFAGGGALTRIGNEAFRGCADLTQISLPGTLFSLGSGAFRGCVKLTQITIPARVNQISPQTFYGCTALAGVQLHSQITLIGDQAFYKCALADITLSSSLQSIGEYAFAYCPLTGITLPSLITSVPRGAFYGCGQLAAVQLPDQLTGIGPAAFRDCKALAGLSLPQSVADIGSSAFYGCESMTELTLPGAVTAIGSDAFYGCKQLSRISLPANLTAINSGAFTNCKALTTLNLPETLTTIGAQAFYGSGLTYLTVPGSVKSIPDRAFGMCKSLQKLTLSPGVTTVQSTALMSCSAMTAVTLPRSVKSIPAALFNDCTALAQLYTAEECAAEEWFRANKPEVAIVYLWGPAAVTGISLDRSSVTLSWHAHTTLSATVAPAEAKNRGVIWTSSDPEYVSVDENGRVTALRGGCTVQITARTLEGGFEAVCQVKVSEARLTVYFDANGGTFQLDHGTVTLENDMTWGDLPHAEKDGYDFDGWYIGEGDSAVLIEPEMPVGWPESSTLTIHAHWSEHTDPDRIAFVIDTLEAIDDRIHIRGWAYDKQSVGTALKLRLEYGDETQDFVCSGHRPDVNSAFGIDGLHGFDFISNKITGSTVDFRISAFYAGQDKMIEIASGTLELGTDRLMSSVDRLEADGCVLSIEGWVFDRLAGSSALPLRIEYADQAEYIDCTGHRIDVNSAYGIDGLHGFTFRSSLRLAGDCEVKIYAYFADLEGEKMICSGIVHFDEAESLLVLPAGLKTISEEAFAGNTGIQRVIVPDGCEAIAENAFAGCTRLVSVSVPADTFISDDAFDDGVVIEIREP